MNQPHTVVRRVRVPRRVQVLVSIGLVALLSLWMVTVNTVAIVQPGTVGVVTRLGAVQSGVLPEGMHTVNPFTDSVHPIDVRIQKLDAEASASSRDLQPVKSRLALNYFVDKEAANVVFQELGPDYRNTILAPSLQESVKSATARFTAEQLITRRPEVKAAIYGDLKERLARSHIVVTDFSIVDFHFSDAFNRAIEEKQVAEQDALRAGNDLRRVEIEGEQLRVQARARAEAHLEEARAEVEAQRLLRETLTDEIIALRAAEQWNGQLPLSMGGDGSFVDVVSAWQASAP